MPTILNPSPELPGLLPIHEADISESQGKDFEGKYLHVHTEYNSLSLFGSIHDIQEVSAIGSSLWSLIGGDHPL
jgi:hypothetical protein